MHFVDRARNEILPNCGDASADADVFTIRSFSCLLQRRLDSIGDEVERRASVISSGARA